MSKTKLTYSPNPLVLGMVVVRGSEAIGDPIPVDVTNSGDTMLEEMTVSIEGNEASTVQLAKDEVDEPGVWAATGRGIRPVDGDVSPGQSFRFWARAVFSKHDSDGKHDFQIVFRCLSVPK